MFGPISGATVALSSNRASCRNKHGCERRSRGTRRWELVKHAKQVRLRRQGARVTTTFSRCMIGLPPASHWAVTMWMPGVLKAWGTSAYDS